MCPRQASGEVSVEVQPVFLCSWQELLGDLELTRIGLEHGMPHKLPGTRGDVTTGARKLSPLPEVGL